MRYSYWLLIIILKFLSVYCTEQYIWYRWKYNSQNNWKLLLQISLSQNLCLGFFYITIFCMEWLRIIIQFTSLRIINVEKENKCRRKSVKIAVNLIFLLFIFTRRWSWAVTVHSLLNTFFFLLLIFYSEFYSWFMNYFCLLYILFA